MARTDLLIALQRCLHPLARDTAERECLLGGLPALWPRLAPQLRLQVLRPGALLLAQGVPPQAFYAVASGEIEARFTAADGTVSVIERLRPPSLFGLAAFAAGQPSSYEALAATPAEVLAIGQPAYALMMDELAGFARCLLREFAGRFDGTLRLLAASRHASAAERLHLALQQLAAQRGSPDEAPGWRRLPCTQAELAVLAHVSRQTVNEWLQQQARDGRLRLGYRWLSINEPLWSEPWTV
ncbi:Crp/Fnr family transcriptional regulator [Paucibacter sp. APW11]|uniref:Crp/Fnr family transcriptional regulator n=1 Tax=Roseateles aquae TaxID=3077235 RepID=A0ABU3PH41_9BURK|nr:Crp/Fnr family transcriptional regulator [Paucibacter sp. APW11]MDT9001871.1 Crp/Fnr family transcriptional regulator [Paucibacter sp. APW11]